MIVELPSAFTEEQIKAVISILAKDLPSYIQPGIQFLQTDCDRQKPTDFHSLEALVHSIVPSDFHLEVHAPICPHNPRSDLNLANPKSVDILLANAYFAKEIGAETLIVHTNTVYYPTPALDRDPATIWEASNNDFKTMCRNIREKMYINLLVLGEESPVVIGVENMPLPLNGDRCSSAAGIIYEPNMISYEDLQEFCLGTKECPKLKMVYDTSHGSLAKGILDELREQGTDTSEKLLRTPFRGIYPEEIGVQPALLYVVKMIYNQDKLASIHLTEAGGLWREGEMIEEDGPLGGKEYPQLLEMVRYLQRTNTPISLDIREEDYISRPHQRASLRKLLTDLSA